MSMQYEYSNAIFNCQTPYQGHLMKLDGSGYISKFLRKLSKSV